MIWNLSFVIKLGMDCIITNNKPYFNLYKIIMTEINPCKLCGTTDHRISKRYKRKSGEFYEYVLYHTCLTNDYLTTFRAVTEEELIENWNNWKVKTKIKQLLINKDGSI